jgi:hypothetical protein
VNGSAIRRAWCTALGAAVILTSAACSTDQVATTQPPASITSSTPTTSPSPTSTTSSAPSRLEVPDLADVDRQDPDAVATAAVTTINQWDTTTDQSPADALRRAAPLLSTELVTDSIAALPPQGSAFWSELAGHQGYTDVTVTLANEYGQPRNTDTAATSVTSYVVTATGDDGWNQTADPAVLRVRMGRPTTADPWTVTGFTVWGRP